MSRGTVEEKKDIKSLLVQGGEISGEREKTLSEIPLGRSFLMVEKKE